MPRLSAFLAGAVLLLPPPSAPAGPLLREFLGIGTSAADDQRLPPSAYGYYLDEHAAGYYGGSRYREYYAYGRGYGFANFPGPVPPRFDRPMYPTPRVVVARDETATLVVRVPEGAEVWLEGAATGQGGAERLFASPPLPRGVAHVYEVRARWDDGGRVVEQTQQVVVTGGRRYELTFPTR